MKNFEIEKTATFDIKQTLECGQVFRFFEYGDAYRIMAGNHIANVRESDDKYVIECDDEEFFRHYFDFETDYESIQSAVREEGFLSEAIDFGKGIHILRQDPTEAVFSFIISQNNHIPRIKGIIDRICNELGENMGEYHAFPSVSAMASVGEDFFKSIGAGYRASYLDRVAKSLIDEDVSEWNTLPTPQLREKLMSLHGVGRKVADCALLFGFNRFDVFPVDTWIRKAFENEFPKANAEEMSVLLVEKYGEYAGFVQQWAFYYKREKKV